MTVTDFRIDDLMSIDQAVERWPDKFSRDELVRAARAKILRHIRKGRRKLTTEAWLNAYVARGEVKPCPSDNNPKPDSNSGDTGSSGKAPAGAALGMTPEQAESAAKHLAQKIMKKPSSS
jgi:hypothetical protein